MTQAPLFTLIIPAHNEEAVIARCLATAQKGAPSADCFEIIVAANGCDDNTVAEARRAAPHAVVLDLAEGSKTGAINAANARASHYPRIYLDADVECSYASLAAMASVLMESGVMTAAPGIRLELSHCNALVRAYYGAWKLQPYAKAGKGGAGCYGLSEAAINQVGTFPPIIGDDIWIHTRFPDEEKRLIARDNEGQPVFSLVRPPSTAWQQVKVEARRMLGNVEVQRKYPSEYFGLIKKGGGFFGSLKSGASIFELLVFYGVKALVRLEMRRSQLSGQGMNWTRDLSSRQL